MSTKELRPNRFIFSTDFMHLAKAGSITKNITIPSRTIAKNNATYVGYVDADFPIPQGAIVRSVVNYRGANMQTSTPNLTNGSIQIEEMWDRLIVWRIFWERLNDQKIRVNYYITHYDTSTAVTAPAITFTLTQTAYKPPNA